MSEVLVFTDFVSFSQPICDDGVIDAWLESDVLLLDSEDEYEIDDDQMYKLRKYEDGETTDSDESSQDGDTTVNSSKLKKIHGQLGLSSKTVEQFADAKKNNDPGGTVHAQHQQDQGKERLRRTNLVNGRNHSADQLSQEDEQVLAQEQLVHNNNTDDKHVEEHKLKHNTSSDEAGDEDEESDHTGIDADVDEGSNEEEEENDTLSERFFYTGIFKTNSEEHELYNDRVLRQRAYGTSRDPADLCFPKNDNGNKSKKFQSHYHYVDKIQYNRFGNFYKGESNSDEVNVEEEEEEDDDDEDDGDAHAQGGVEQQSSTYNMLVDNDDQSSEGGSASGAVELTKFLSRGSKTQSDVSKEQSSKRSNGEHRNFRTGLAEPKSSINRDNAFARKRFKVAEQPPVGERVGARTEVTSTKKRDLTADEVKRCVVVDCSAGELADLDEEPDYKDILRNNWRLSKYHKHRMKKLELLEEMDMSETDSVEVLDEEIETVKHDKEEEAWENRRKLNLRDGLYGVSPDMLNVQSGLDDTNEPVFRKSEYSINGLDWKFVCQEHKNRLVLEDNIETRSQYLGSLCYVNMKTFVNNELKGKMEKIDFFRHNKRNIAFDLPSLPIRSSPFRVYRVEIDLILLDRKRSYSDIFDRLLRASDFVLVAASGHVFHTHTQLLSFCSPVFTKIIAEHRYQGTFEITPIVLSCSEHAVQLFLRLLYGELYDLHTFEVEEVLQMAQQFKSNFHLFKIEKFMLNMKHSHKVFALAYKYNLHHLLNECSRHWEGLKHTHPDDEDEYSDYDIETFPHIKRRPIYPLRYSHTFKEIEKMKVGTSRRSVVRVDKCNKIAWYIRIKKKRDRLVAQLLYKTSSDRLGLYKFLPKYENDVSYYEIFLSSIKDDRVYVSFRVLDLQIRLDVKLFMNVDFTDKELVAADLKIVIGEDALYCHSQVFGMHSDTMNQRIRQLPSICDKKTGRKYLVMNVDDATYPVMKLTLTLLYDFCLWKSNLHINRILSLIEPLLEFATKYGYCKVITTVEHIYLSSGLYIISPIIIWKYNFQLCQYFLILQFKRNPMLKDNLAKLIVRKDFLQLNSSVQRRISEALNDEFPLFY